MNDKEKELWRVIDNVIKCCAIELPSGELSITTIATVLNRTVPAVRHLCKMAYSYISTSRVYRLATAQATLLNKDVEPICI